jgi:5'-phosphate synthase pdxT subunit
MKIGVLDIQGSVEEHFEALKKLGVKRRDLKIEPVLVKKISDLDGVRGLIIPGGESTTIGKLLKKTGLWEEIKKRAKGAAGSKRRCLAHLRAGSKDTFASLGVWGTCAGAILLSKGYFGLMDITVERNAYGRQMESFETEIEFDGINVPAIFIRAPRIVKVGCGVKVLAKCGGEIVAASQGRFLATTFHPELTESLKILCQFVELSL